MRDSTVNPYKIKWRTALGKNGFAKKDYPDPDQKDVRKPKADHRRQAAA
jgi:hypothetical protein